MMLKHISLLLLAFTFTHNTHCCAGPSGIEGAVTVGGVIAVLTSGVSACINTPLLIGKELGLKRSLPAKNIVLSSLACNGLTTVIYLTCNVRYYKDRPQAEQYDINYHTVCDYLPASIVAGIALTTAYNIYQCTKEEPVKSKDPKDLSLCTKQP